MSRSRPGLALLLMVAAAALLTAHDAPQRSAAKAPDLTAACGTTNPYLAVARFAAAKNYRLDPDAPSVVALRDTAADDLGSQVTLATQGQTGAVFGLAYDAGRGQIYASAYHKRGAPFGPGGTGGIYRIDLAAGTVRTLTSLQGGLDRHDLKDRDDELAGLWVGRASLGDIDMAPDGSQLFVADLFDGKVYRLRLPDGAVLGSFRHGGYGKTWQSDARLFALAADERWLYHGVMDMGRVNQRPATAHIFRSDWNGSAMEEVTQFEAGVAMADEGNPGPGTLLFTDMALLPPAQPGGEPGILAAFRDRLQDRQVSQADLVDLRAPVVRWTRAEGAATRAYTVNAQGGLAAIPGLNFWALSGSGRSRPPSAASLMGRPARPEQLPLSWRGEVSWLDAAAPVPAAPFAAEPATEAFSDPSSIALRASLGDVEALCPWRTDLDPVLATTATAEVGGRQTAVAEVPLTAIAATAAAFATRYGPTLTAFVSATPRPPGSTPPAGGVRERLLASCQGDEPAYAVSIFAHNGALSVLRRHDAVLAFDGKPVDQLRLADQGQIGAVYGLAYDHRRLQLYASAYVKRDAPLGALGPGGIYRIDLPTGQVAAWAMLPAGPDLHNFGINDDQAIIPWLGWLGLGDIDLSDDGRELFVVNAFDGRVYRLSVPDGRILGSFANGGSQESWAAGARPMGLGVWGDKLYHGVVNSSAYGGPNEAAVFVSERDGSAMRLVLRLNLDYRKDASAWKPWRDQSFGGGHEALLSDIAVRRNGDLLLGLRDRRGDNGLLIPEGDLIIARQQGGQWVPDTSSGGEFYKDDLFHAEPLWGGLALSPLGDRVVSTALGPLEIYSAGAVWFDNDTGMPGLKETLYRRKVVDDSEDLTFGKVQGLGDVESLCPPPLIPTFTPAVSPTPIPPSATVTATATPSNVPTASLMPTATATATRTPTVTRTPTATASPTATPVPRPIYLPDLSRGRCAASRQPLEVVLLTDTSLSMTGEKLAAAQKAASTFTGLLNLRAGGDQAAVISFDGAARLIRRLTTSRSGILAGLAELKPATGTRIDLGLKAAMTELSSARVRAGADKVILLLTDGLPTTGTGDEAQDAATAARRLGIDLWAIGLGGDADPDFLRQLTGSAARVRVAPGARDLEAVYKQVAGALTCR